jgi:hypothetical protein
VPKVQNKPIKSLRKGSDRKEQNQPEAALVWRTGLSGAPRRLTPNSPPSGFWKCHSAIIHRTVRCAMRSNGYNTNSLLQKWTVKLQCADSARRVRVGARRRTEQWTVTVRWPHLSELQWSNPNGWVTWLAHRTVSGGAPDYPVRPSTAAFPNGHFGGWGYKYPQPSHFKTSKFSANIFNTRVNAFNTRHN